MDLVRNAFMLFFPLVTAPLVLEIIIRNSVKCINGRIRTINPHKDDYDSSYTTEVDEKPMVTGGLVGIYLKIVHLCKFMYESRFDCRQSSH